ncbi:DUF1643 domain-containing protein [Cohnella herbarum]|uniref:DUF1643 domain-containing protein n=1 Tax=Cohnella herbarum TaxID=2728023 RepID=A0A7Z2VJ84_9BACL|nr:DUF1643 domain-containing protein [Cohnella herbarum]QJD84251.1 DUF1643 domain-containing protein [Cohnella herbarum]
MINAKAIHDVTGKKRYYLIKTWDEKKPIVTSLLYNPNDATSLMNDKTVNNVFNITVQAENNRFGSLIVVNLIPIKSKSPSLLSKHEKLEDEDNVEFLKEAFYLSDIILVGWGVDGGKIRNFPKTKELLLQHRSKLRCLGTTGNNIPSHPSRKTDKVIWSIYTLT